MSENIDEVFIEMRKAHEALKDTLDNKIQDASNKEVIEKINEDISSLRSEHDELIKKSQRPSGHERAEIDEDTEIRNSAFEKYVRTGDSVEYRALSNSSDSDGDFLVPNGFENQVIKQAYNESEIRPIANVGTTGRDAVLLPALSKPTVAWGIANLTIPEQDVNAGQERIEIFDLRALTLIANNTLEDSQADVWSELVDLFSMALSEKEDDAFAAGSYPGPQGVITNPLVQANSVNTGVAAALSDGSNNGVDALITMLHSLKKVYRRNATWAMNSLTEGAVRKFKDAEGQYLWQPPVSAGTPATLLGRPVINPENMPDVAANSLSIALGDFRKGYYIRDRAGMSVKRLVERYADMDQTGFIVKKRVGGQVVLPEAFMVLKTAV